MENPFEQILERLDRIEKAIKSIKKTLHIIFYIYTIVLNRFSGNHLP